MVHQPHGHLRDAGGPFADLDAVEGVHVHQQEPLDVQNPLNLQRQEHLDLQQAQFAVGDDEEIAAAAGGVQEAELADLLVEAPQLGLVGPDALELGAQAVKEEGADDLEDVALAGVVPADLAALARLHDRLEERAEDRRRDARPVKAGAGQQGVAHVPIQVGKAQAFGEEVAVDIGEGGKGLVEVLLSPFGRGVEHIEKPGQVRAKVAPIGLGLVLDVETEGLSLEDAGVLPKEAKQNAHEEPLQLVPLVSAGFQGVVQVAEDLNCLEVDRVLILEPVLLVAWDEGEGVGMVVEVRQRELDSLDGAQQGHCPLVLGFQVVQGDAGEVRDDHIAGHLVPSPVTDEVLNVTERLGLGFAQILSLALVLHQERPAPEEVDKTVIPREVPYRLFEAGHRSPAQAEDPKELVPEGLLFRGFLLGLSPVVGKAYGVVTNFIP